MTVKDIENECLKRVEEAIKSGKLLREFDIRMILRQVINEALEKGEKK